MQRKATDYSIGHDENDVFICRSLKNGKVSDDITKINPSEITSLVIWWIEKEFKKVSKNEGIAVINPNGDQYIIYRKSPSLDKEYAYEEAQKIIDLQNIK